MHAHLIYDVVHLIGIEHRLVANGATKTSILVKVSHCCMSFCWYIHIVLTANCLIKYQIHLFRFLLFTRIMCYNVGKNAAIWRKQLGEYGSIILFDIICEFCVNDLFLVYYTYDIDRHMNECSSYLWCCSSYRYRTSFGCKWSHENINTG